jgi:hypothetical protein
MFETLKKLSQRKPAYIFLDETDNKIKEIPLSKLDSAGSALTRKQNPAKEIHKAIFG